MNTEDFSINGKDFKANIRKITGLTGRGFLIEDLQTQVSYSPTQLNLKDLNLKTDLSNIQGDITMDYQSGDFTDFNNKVQLDAQFKYADLSTSDLAKFYAEFGYGEKLSFNGHLTGVMNDFDLENINLSGMRNSKIIAQKLNFKNILDEEKSFILEGNFGKLQTDYSDLANLLPRILGKS